VSPQNESARTQLRVIGRSSNSPPPKSAQGQLYALMAAGGMARKWEHYRKAG